MLPQTLRPVFRHFVAVDLGWRSDIPAARRILSDGGYAILNGILPESQLQFRFPSKRIADESLSSADSVEMTLYDSGALSIAWTFESDRDLSLEEIARAVNALGRHQSILDQVRSLGEAVSTLLHSTLQEVQLRAEVEDHTVVWLPLGEKSIESILSSESPWIAQILSTEEFELAPSAVERMLRTRFAFSKHDLTICAWAASVILVEGTDAVVADWLARATAILELVNAQILELDTLEAELEALTERSEQVLDRSTVSDREMRELAWSANQLVALHLKVRSGLELLDIEMLGLFHEQVVERFRFAHRMETIESLKAQLDRIFDWSEAAKNHAEGTKQYRTMHRVEVAVMLLVAVEVAFTIHEHWPAIRGFIFSVMSAAGKG